MKVEIFRTVFHAGRFFVLAAATLSVAAAGRAEPLVPGSGVNLTQVGDDFEDESWEYVPNSPKSSSDVDEQVRYPAGKSANGRWIESSKRGHMDIIRRVATPPNGLPGSQGSLLLQSYYTGVPGRPSYQGHQDDLLLNVNARVGGFIPVSSSPSAVVRVFLPSFDQWEDRSGTSFALRAGVRAYTTKETGRGLFRRKSTQLEPYWPGMFIHFNSETDQRFKEDSAMFYIRAGRSGRNVRGPQITQTGWWTLGMSFTPDGQVHYYAKPGVDDLTQADYITSQYPYGFRCEKFNTIFFNVANANNGRDWSTPWIIDDPAVFVVNGYRQAQKSLPASR